MKKFGWLVGAVLALALCAGAVFAQISVNRVTANVPFAFYVGKTELPAGRYEIYQPGDTALDLVIRNMETGRAILVPVLTQGIPNETGTAELVFKKVDDKPYLSEVLPRWSDGYELKGIHVKHTASTASLPTTTVAGE